MPHNGFLPLTDTAREPFIRVVVTASRDVWVAEDRIAVTSDFRISWLDLDLNQIFCYDEVDTERVSRQFSCITEGNHAHKLKTPEDSQKRAKCWRRVIQR